MFKWLLPKSAAFSIALSLLLFANVAAAGDVERVASCVAVTDGETHTRTSKSDLDGGYRAPSDGKQESKATQTKITTGRKATTSRVNRASAESIEPKLQNCFDLD
jgi:hypothetical protein